MANAGVRQFQNGPSMLPAAAVDGGRVVGSKLMIRLIGRVAATVKAVGVPALPLRYAAIEYTVSVPVAPQNRDFICY